MSRAVTRRSEPDRIRELLQRVANLERRIRDAESATSDGETEVVFNLSSLSLGTSPPYQVRVAQSLYEVKLGLATAGSTSTVVTIYNNAVSVGTATIAAAAVNSTTSFASSFAVDDDMTVAVTTIGTSAYGLVVQCRLR